MCCSATFRISTRARSRRRRRRWCRRRRWRGRPSGSIWGSTCCSDAVKRRPADRDFKSAFQELVQARELSLPEYRLVGSAGPDHHKVFHVEVIVNGDRIAAATGASKKEAEQEAARAALEKLAIRN